VKPKWCTNFSPLLAIVNDFSHFPIALKALLSCFFKVVTHVMMKNFLKDFFFEIYGNARKKKEEKKVEWMVYILEVFFQLAKESLK
jgi:hypothetical protein